MVPNKAQAIPLTAILVVTALAGCTVMSTDEPPQTREITFWVEEIDWALHPNVEQRVWAFCAEGNGVEQVWDGPCSVPGPTVRVNEGDTVRVTFRNTHGIPHTVHFHGQHPYSADMNGNRLLGDGMVVGPGEDLTVEWVADPAGTFIYHCHFDTPTHMEMGMYGAFIVDARDEPEPVDHDFIAILDEWHVDLPGALGTGFPDYNFFTINGRSFPLTQPMLVDVGDKVRIHMINAGYQFHAMHLHGYTPDSWEGVAGWRHAVPTDVREIAPGQSVVLDFEAVREGVWLFHDHVVPSVTAAGGEGFGAYPRGMLSALVVGDAYAAALPDVAGAILKAAQGDVAPAPAQQHSPSESGAPAHDAAVEAAEEPAAPVPTVRAKMAGFAFDAELRVAAGSRVVWTNEDSVYHTVTLADGSVDSGRIEAGESWSHVFDTPGTYEYYCKPHAYEGDDGWKGMVGTLIVEE